MSDALDMATSAFEDAVKQNTTEAVAQALADLDDIEAPAEDEGRFGLLASGLDQLLQSLERGEESA